MKLKIETHLCNNPSYFKWSNQRLAAKYNCSEKTISNIVKKLQNVKENYLQSL